MLIYVYAISYVSYNMMKARSRVGFDSTGLSSKILANHILFM